MLVVVAGATIAAAQAAETPPAETTMFPHPDDRRWWLSGQVNLISQLHGRFTSPYQGDNSLRPEAEQALSRLWTIYTGVKLPGHTELLFDVESAGGRGLSGDLHAKVTNVLVELTAYNVMRLLHELQSERARIALGQG
jgi:hypothetical protein